MTTSDEIILVCMPFGGVFAPSIGLSLLKAELAAQGVVARVFYSSIRFAELIGQHFYYGLSTDGRPSIEDLAGEWIFSRALFGASAENEAYVDEILRKHTTWLTNDHEKPASPALIGQILHARNEVHGFLDWCRDEILRARPKLVGFSSMFQQHVASLALARLVKEALPGTFVVFGGANCADVMGAETVRRFPFVDAAVSGEADLVFPDLVHRVLEGRCVAGLPGVRTRGEAQPPTGRFSHGPMVRNLDALPYPDYSDYFQQFEASQYGRDWQPRIYLETARGCWWGEKKHCTFCGLNSRTMTFRSKSPTRAMDELVWLTRRHPGCAIHATDNILDMRYLESFVPQLAARRPRVRIFYEVKANLGKEQLRLLRDAGIRRIQPGIESLSDPVLRLMRKGVSGLQNVQLLKWCKELGIDPGWNLLWGLPGEPPDEYARMAELVPLLAHLPPPGGYGVVRLDRFSPNFDDAERLGLANVRPVPPYRYVYPLPSKALARLASFFTFEYREPRDLAGYVRPLEKKLRTWPGLFGKCDLFSVDLGKWLLVWDLRPVSRALLTALHGMDRLLYRACDAACDPRHLAESAALHLEAPISPEEVTRRLDALVERGLMVRDASRYLALAIPLGEYSPPARAAERFCALVRALGRRVPGGFVVSPDQDAAARRSRALKACSRRRGRLRSRRAARLTASQFFVGARGDVRVRVVPGH